MLSFEMRPMRRLGTGLFTGAVLGLSALIPLAQAQAPALPSPVERNLSSLAPIAQPGAASIVPKPSVPAFSAADRAELEQGRAVSGVVVYPPSDSQQSRSLVVMLHGMCGAPESECPAYANATRTSDWLLCPRAGLRCGGGGATWQSSGLAESVESAIRRTAERRPELSTVEDRVLVGFSLGGIRGMDLAHQGQGKWQGVILIGAKVYPDPVKLRAAGVERVLLAAGDYDMMSPHMAAQARKLIRRGYPAAFMSLGKVGHRFPDHYEEYLSRALRWVKGEDNAFIPQGPAEIVGPTPGVRDLQ